jgi:hypothetical protein
VFQQLEPGDNPTGIIHQMMQDHKFLMWQMNWFPSDEKPVTIQMQLDVTDSQDPQPPETLGIDRQVMACLLCVRWRRSLHR